MPAKIAFDYEQAIDRAMQVFWKKGYSNASLRDLLKAMGIGEGSFYNTLKSKRDLYLACLKHYNDTVSRRRLNALVGPPSVKEGVRSFFRTVLDELDDTNTPQVCLLAGSLARDVLSERVLNRYVVAEMKAFGNAFTERFRSAKKSGELPQDFDAEVVSHVIIAYLQGLFRVIRVLQNRREVERQVESLLVGLGL